MDKIILETLRQRRGLEKDDSSKDEDIERMPPALKVRHLTAWHLGDGGWANSIAAWMKECGATPEDF